MSNNSFGRAVTRTPNSDTITLSGRLSGVGDYLGSYDHSRDEHRQLPAQIGRNKTIRQMSRNTWANRPLASLPDPQGYRDVTLRS